MDVAEVEPGIQSIPVGKLDRLYQSATVFHIECERCGEDSCLIAPASNLVTDNCRHCGKEYWVGGLSPRDDVFGWEELDDSDE